MANNLIDKGGRLNKENYYSDYYYANGACLLPVDSFSKTEPRE